MIFIHGWRRSPDSPNIQTLLNAYLVNGSFNILALDWSETASGIFLDQVAHKIEPLGIAVALFIERWNLQKGIPFSSMHLVGHSLGAHLAGSAGKNIKEWSGQTKYIERITGLDPASTADDFLQWRYARFVDIIHTDANGAGTNKNTGHVDFWPNNGVAVQPGCPPILFQPRCSHRRSIVLYAESVQRAYRSANFLSTNKDNASDVIEMGLNCPTNARGVYSLSTNGHSWYSQS
ncbi:lipase member H-like [Bradysia coprophila]|uniref:lipase member H-like n=1 Tax=Bradysia coprophila TaxID=38358 RepID=UPI00187DAFEB|nr:lipase member H-like [Bradysia coprophila]